MRTRIAVFVVIIQSVLFLAHWFLYETWIAFWATPDFAGISKLQVALALLSVSFVVASLLAWRSSNVAVRVLYRISAVWLGFLSFCFLAACSCWMVYGGARLLGLHPNQRRIVTAFFALAVLASLYGVVNAGVDARAPGCRQIAQPAGVLARTGCRTDQRYSSRSRSRRQILAAHCDDDHTSESGHRLYRGRHVRRHLAKVHELAAPLAKLAVPWGAYFVAGNHEEFSDSTKYFDAVKQSGVRVLNSEKVTVDGLQIVGVHYRDSTNDDRFRAALRGAGVDRERASILLTHAPDRVSIAEEEGFSLAALRSHSRWPVFPFHLDHFPAVRKICLRITTAGKSAGIHILWSRYVGAAVAGRNQA